MRRRRSPSRRSMIARISGTPLVAQSRCSKSARSDGRTMTRSATPGNDPEGIVPRSWVKCRGQMPCVMVRSSSGSRSPSNAGAPSRSHHAQTILIRGALDRTAQGTPMTSCWTYATRTDLREGLLRYERRSAQNRSGRKPAEGPGGAVCWPACDGGRPLCWGS